MSDNPNAYVPDAIDLWQEVCQVVWRRHRAQLEDARWGNQPYTVPHTRLFEACADHFDYEVEKYHAQRKR